MRKSALIHLIKIVKCLEEAEGGWLWPSEIAKRCEIHRTTVVRLIDAHLSNFVQEETVGPTNIRMFRLKPGVNTEGIVKYLSVKEKLNAATGKGKTAIKIKG